MTFKQASDKGGKVRKGEKATQVVFASTIHYLDGKRVKDYKELTDEEKKKVNSVYFLKFYHVFNVEQIDGLPDEMYVIPNYNKDDRNARIEEFVSKFREDGVLVESLNEIAFYRPSDDKVHMPDFRQFKSADEYYLVMFHELTHWAGGNGNNRLKRPKVSKYELEGYAYEELIAELGAGILAYEYDVDSELATNENAAYIRSWLRALKNDTSFIFRAAREAEKSAKYLLDYKKGDA